MNQPIAIMWFEQDLRLSDNPALTAALEHPSVLPIFILDESNAGEFQLGGASRWWLQQSLSQLNVQLGGQLNIYQGDAEWVIEQLTQRFTVESVSWNRRYEPWRVARDTKIKTMLNSQGIKATSFNGTLLNEPWTVLKKDHTPYKVFSPYHRQCLNTAIEQPPLAEPTLPPVMVVDKCAATLESLALTDGYTWADKLASHWHPGEASAHSQLNEFIKSGLARYKEDRDFPARQVVSKLSPHLHFGEISPRQIVHELILIPLENNKVHYIRELYWRDFSYQLLFHWPEMPRKNLQTSFDRFPWRQDVSNLTLWQKGLTGYPIVDAGMRELWQTGYMHNRVRMIAASFLVKNLLVDWRKGAQWFWGCLVDADLANNSASWQWVAGCGTDAAPYFRIFNPVTQGEKFDPEGNYTKQFLPELKDLPVKYLFRPWEAPAEVLKEAQVILGENYPNPIVDLKASRERALIAYKQTS